MNQWRRAALVVALAIALGLTQVAGPGRPPEAHAQAFGGVIPAGDVWNLAAPGANTNIFTTSLKPKTGASVYRITVVLATTSVFNEIETDGTTTFTSALNSGTALTAGQVYTFVIGTRQMTPAAKTIFYNFQVATNGIINVLRVDEVLGAVD